jgi:hypothetical protein
MRRPSMLDQEVDREKTASALMLTMALIIPALAAPPPCEVGEPGCKTVDDPDKRNEKFTETQRGNLDAPGTKSTCVGANPGQTKQVCD